MKQGIAITTWSGGKPQLDLLLYSLRGYRKYPFYIIYNDITNGPVNQLIDLQQDYTLLGSREDRYECGALQALRDNTDLEEFILLQDTIEILNPGFFEKMFDMAGSVAYGPKFPFFLGKFRREVLEKVEIPLTLTKHESIAAEGSFLHTYMAAEPNMQVFDPLFYPVIDDEHVHMKWGRANLITENRYLIKRQGTWMER